MITKAFVEEIVSPHKARVRIPVLDRVAAGGIYTSTDNLGIATICTLPNCYVNIQPGDVVFVGFEDHCERKPIVLGHLSCEACKSFTDLTVNSLTINGSLHAGNDVQLGEITTQELQHLSGLNMNIQKQFNTIAEQIKQLQETIDTRS